MRYIDADKLIAEIERRQKQRIETNAKIAKGEIFTDTENEFNRLLARYGNRLVYQELFEIICFIESLQHEQSELPGYDKALLEVKSKVDELYEEASIGLNEYDSGFYNGIVETCMKLRGFIKARTSKEQPEVDLDEEIKAEWDVIDTDLLRFEEFKAICYSFYERGLNARKEE